MSTSQDMIFTLYGDYIRHRGGEAWTGSLIELLGLLGLSDQAVRSTLSRLSRKGWLKARRLGRHSFYAQTPKLLGLLEEGAERLFQPRSDPWDGQWHVLTYSIPESKRHLRRRLRERLLWLGFGTLNNATWISPRDRRGEVEQIVDGLRVRRYVDLFSGRHHGFCDDAEIVSRCWDLHRLNDYYARFIDRHESLFSEQSAQSAQGCGLDRREAFAQRFMLVHEYRLSPYVDPNLPLALLPDAWLGEKATRMFHQYRELLADEANSFVDSVLAKSP